MKTCSRCKKEKSLLEFHKQKKSTDGHAWYCKMCKCEQAKEWRKTPSGIDSQKRKNKSNARYNQIKSRYGLSMEAFHELVDGVSHCQICGNTFVGREPVIDHCHKSEKVRGVLCLSCNSMLGYAKDDAEILEAAIAYLKTTASSAECNACGEEGAGSGRKTRVKPASMKQEVSGRFAQH